MRSRVALLKRLGDVLIVLVPPTFGRVVDHREAKYAFLGRRVSLFSAHVSLQHPCPPDSLAVCRTCRLVAALVNSIGLSKLGCGSHARAQK